MKNARLLIDWLQHIDWEATTFILPFPDNIQKRNLAEAQLSVLRAFKLRPTDNDTTTIRIELRNWRITTETIALLAGLPKWRACLDMRTCVWAVGPSQCKELAKYVPHEYTELRMHAKMACTMTAEAIRAGGELYRVKRKLPVPALTWRM